MNLPAGVYADWVTCAVTVVGRRVGRRCLKPGTRRASG